MQPIHVLHIIDGLNIGGAEVQVCQLIRGLHGERYRVSVCYSTPGPLEADIAALGVPMTRLRRLGRVDPFLLFGMCRVIRRDPPQIVHTHLIKSDLHGRLAARLCGVPVVISSLRNCDDWTKNPVLGRIYGASARLADRLVAVSEDVRRFEIAHAHLPPGKVCTIENGVDLRRFDGQETAGLAIRQQFGVPVDAPLIGIVGRLKPQKDHATFLRAAAQILQALPGTRFLVVGDGPLRETLMAQASALGLAPAVTFCGFRRDIPGVMAALDLLVLSSHYEGLPGTLLEGMAAARPFVATAVDGIKGLVVDDSAGFLVPPGNPAALAQACVRVLKDPELGKRMGQAGRARVEKYFSSETTIRRTAQLYEELLRQRGIGYRAPQALTTPGER